MDCLSGNLECEECATPDGVLAEAIGAVLDKHVGWQMHRGQMIEDLCEVATSPTLNPDGAKAIVEMLRDYKRRTGLDTLGL